ncbi:MAG: DDE transposase family protein [Stigonema ocellatum SAG 48.90 = DSM 106950]|nr:DDE transposase family protein [Stigonema ocellatum SAG 48.90 = DSM 106950]
MNPAQSWHIVKRPAGHCEIVPSNEVPEDNHPEIIEQWGPFTSEGEAIKSRVGLIRAGKCQPL